MSIYRPGKLCPEALKYRRKHGIPEDAPKYAVYSNKDKRGVVDVDEVVRLRREGLTNVQIGEIVGAKRSSVYYVLQRYDDRIQFLVLQRQMEKGSGAIEVMADRTTFEAHCKVCADRFVGRTAEEAIRKAVEHEDEAARRVARGLTDPKTHKDIEDVSKVATA